MWITAVATVRRSELSIPQAQWGPPTAGIVVAGIGGVVLGLGAVMLVTDPPGRALVGIAAVGLLVFALMSWRSRPKLAIVDGVLSLSKVGGGQILFEDLGDGDWHTDTMLGGDGSILIYVV